MGWQYQQKPPMGWPLDYDSGLVPEAGFWLFNEGSGGQVFDLSGNGYLATLTNGVWGTGKFGADLVFTSGYGTLTKTLTMTNRNFTVVTWVKSPTNIKSGVFGSDHATTPYELLSIHTNESGNIQCYIGDGSTYDIKSVTSPGTTGWHQYAITVASPTSTPVLFYYDGRLISTSTNIGKNPASFNVEIGSHGYRPLEGEQDTTLLYNRVLSASEIALLYREPFCMFKDPAEIALLGGYQGAPPGTILPQITSAYMRLSA